MRGRRDEELRNLGEMSNEMLCKHLERRGLSTMGKHAVLKTRLQKALVAAGADAPPDPDADGASGESRDERCTWSPTEPWVTPVALATSRLCQTAKVSRRENAAEVIDLVDDDEYGDQGQLLPRHKRPAPCGRAVCPSGENDDAGSGKMSDEAADAYRPWHSRHDFGFEAGRLEVVAARGTGCAEVAATHSFTAVDMDGNLRLTSTAVKDKNATQAIENKPSETAMSKPNGTGSGMLTAKTGNSRDGHQHRGASSDQGKTGRQHRLRVDEILGTTVVGAPDGQPAVRATIGNPLTRHVLSRFRRWNQSGIAPQTLQKYILQQTYSNYVLRIIDQDLLPQLPQDTDLSDPVVQRAIMSSSMGAASRGEIRAAVKKFVTFFANAAQVEDRGNVAARDDAPGVLVANAPPGSARTRTSVRRRLVSTEKTNVPLRRRSANFVGATYAQRYDVEAIEGCRPMKGSSNGIEYLVKWQGFASSENTWEPEEHLAGNIALCDYKDKLQSTGFHAKTTRNIDWASSLDGYDKYLLSRGLSAATCKVYHAALSRCYSRLDESEKSMLAKRTPAALDALLQAAKQERSNAATPAANVYVRYLRSASASCSQRAGFEKRWRDLSRDEHAAATVLGFDQLSWDSQHVPPSCCDTKLGCVWSWAELDNRLLRAAETLGYTDSTWTFQMEPYLRERLDHSSQNSDPLTKRQKKEFEEVGWDQILPLRFYVAHSKRASSAASAAGRSADAIRSRCIVMQCSTWLRAKIDEQALIHLSEHPEEVVQKHIIVGKIVDETHPCVMSSGGQPVYGAFARECIPANTVLGYYGGLTQTAKSFESVVANHLNPYAFSLRCSEQWQAGDGWLEIDGERGTNELAMVNDFRNDISERALSGDIPQTRTPNAEPIEVWMPSDALPSVVFVSTRDIRKHDEITIDYGTEYWRGFHRRKRHANHAANP